MLHIQLVHERERGLEKERERKGGSKIERERERVSETMEREKGERHKPQNKKEREVSERAYYRGLEREITIKTESATNSDSLRVKPKGEKEITTPGPIDATHIHTLTQSSQSSCGPANTIPIPT